MKYNEVLALKKKFLAVYAEDPARFHKLPGRQGTWTPKMLVELFEMVNEPDPAPQDEMAHILNIDRSTVTRKVNNLDWAQFENALVILCRGKEEALGLEADDYKRDLMSKQTLREHKLEVGTKVASDRIEEAIKRLVPRLQTKSKFPPLYFNRKKISERTPKDMVLLLSDLHVGYEFTMDETGGLGEYNNDVFIRRAANLRKAVLDILKLHGETRPIRKLHIFGLGDFVHGSQLGGQWGPAYTPEDVTEQSFTSATACSEMIECWSNYFEKVEFLGVVGNHGRAGASENSDKIAANWDRATYNLMRAMLKHRPNVFVDCPKSWWKQKEVQGKNFLLLHGDYVKGGIEALLREDYKLQDLVRGITPTPFDYLCLGHFHACREIEKSVGGVLVNGSFLKGDMYSFHKLRVKSRPTQLLLGVHPKHGITWEYKLDLDFNRG